MCLYSDINLRIIHRSASAGETTNDPWRITPLLFRDGSPIQAFPQKIAIDIVEIGESGVASQNLRKKEKLLLVPPSHVISADSVWTSGDAGEVMKHYNDDKQRAFETQIETALEKAEIVTKEKNRASAIAMNAEIRRTKARLSEEVPKLQRLAIKRLKSLTTEELAARKGLVLALPARIESIPDGTAGGPKSTTSYFCIN
ncbi:Uncharacterized protein Rs2_27690 [Raphanus sativus]|nr:Uncharacterized protein Rs2_27690 [Raphanus sativus]